VVPGHNPSGFASRVEVRFSDLWEAAPDALVIVDGEGRIVLVNAQVERLFGYSRAEMLGRPVEMLVPDRFRDVHVGHRGGFFASPSPRPMDVGLELYALHRDGHEVPVEISLSPLETPQGTLVLGDIRDVTDRRRSENALARLAAIVESSEAAIIGKTLDGVITSWNPAAERLYGYTAQETVGRHVSLLLCSEQQNDELTEILRRVARDERVASFETTRRRNQGREVDLSMTVSAIHDSQGRVVGASTLARDITERKRAADALAEAEERFRGAFAQAPIGMALIDLDGRFGQVNQALCGITGYERGQLERMSAEAIMHPDDLGAVLDALPAIRSGEQTLYTTEKRCVHASGHAVWVSLQVTLIHGRDGAPLRFLCQVQDITDRKHYEDRIEEFADHDFLTGLLNRRSFSRELNSQAALAGRYGAEGALLMLDLDYFKYVNDTVGHQAGDDVILRVAELLARRMRETDVLARLGGDEFAVLLRKADAAAAELVARELLQALAEEPIVVAGLRRATTASIGVAMFEGDLTGEDVLVNADLAMYDAKEAGRDRVAPFSEHHAQARMKGRVGWVKRIQTALEEDGFGLLAQPIVDFQTGHVCQYELLLRMADERGDLIPPGAFLYIAERLDIVQQIDAWVITEAIKLLAEQNGVGDGVPLEVNLSGRSIGDPKLLELIDHELSRAGVAPGRLIFEITETAAVEHITTARRFSEHLAELGCRFALDDFGAGFGSFYYLKHLPFDFLKIDGEFIHSCRTNKTDQLVIEAIVGIARGLDKKTIAEFVGDDETVRLLTRLGVDYGQGYHLGRPAPASANIASPARTAPQDSATEY
jgi:diguanylate cyclase (GGDEF)-like protein/PAS domain S-box-containing protein